MSQRCDVKFMGGEDQRFENSRDFPRTGSDGVMLKEVGHRHDSFQ